MYKITQYYQLLSLGGRITDDIYVLCSFLYGPSFLTMSYITLLIT